MANEINSLEDFINGVVLTIDKPYEWSSFDLVKKVKYKLQRKLKVKKLKVGHAGTLDPLATGMMIICTGKQTKNLNQFQDLPKEYVATLKLGESTPSYDLETEVEKTYPTEHITLELVKETLQRFIGEIDQVPPLFSAKKIDGKRAYEFARKGEEAELKANKITITNIEIIEFSLPELTIKVTCSKGTYIRSLAKDIGNALLSGAYLSALKRTAIGSYRIEESMDVKKFEEIVNNL